MRGDGIDGIAEKKSPGGVLQGFDIFERQKGGGDKGFLRVLFCRPKLLT
jgi:hypothetical protein